MSLQHGWNWTGTRWLYLKVPIDVFSPENEQGLCDAANRRHLAMRDTEGGKALKAFQSHGRKCRRCTGVDSLCKTGNRLWDALEEKWRVWCCQVAHAQGRGMEPRELYDAHVQGILDQYG